MKNMKNLIKLLTLFILMLFIPSCSVSKNTQPVLHDAVPTEVNESNTVSESKEVITVTVPTEYAVTAPSRPVEKIVVDLGDFKPTVPQQNLIDKAVKVEQRFIHIVYLDSGGIEVEVAFIGEETLMLISLEDVEKLNNTLRLIEIMEELIDKYSIETGINLTLVDSLNSEIVLLNERVVILNGELDNRNNIIETLNEVVSELRSANLALNNAVGEQTSLLKMKDKEIKKQKTQKWAIAGGSVAAIVLLLLL